MNVEHTKTGYILVSDIVKGERVHRFYNGYTEAEAVKRFKHYVKDNIGLIGGY